MGVHETTVLVNGLPVHYWEAGGENSRALLLIHGGIGDAEMHWSEVIPQLAETYHVIAPDLPGYGMSAVLPDMSMTALIEWLKEFLDALQLEEAVMVGNSIGALLARLFAAAHPKYTPAIILVNGGAIPNLPPALNVLARIPGVSNLIFYLLGRSASSLNSLKGSIFDESLLTESFVKSVQANMGNFARLMKGALLTPLPAARIPPVPTLLLWGANDAMATIADGEALSRELQGSKLAQVADCGQLPQIEATDVFVYQVNYFLGRISRPPQVNLPGVSLLSEK